jgi:alpha-glucosidase
MARKKNDGWFVGAITNNSGRTLDIPLSFLDNEKTYDAVIYSDGGEKIKTRTHVKIDKRRVKAGAVIKAVLQPSGGLAMELQPLTAKSR